MKKVKRLLALALLVTLAITNIACGKKDGESTSTGKTETVKLEFFQNKPEAVESFNKLIAEFQKENPNIIIEQNNMPDPDTVIKTRLTTGDLPEVMALGGSLSGYGEIAKSGMLKDFSQESALKTVIPVYSKIISDLHSGTEGTYGIPYSANANTILYNKDKFKELGIEIPTTWDELIKVCELIKSKGMTPFYHTYKDSWTPMVPFNSIAANIQDANFIKDRRAGTTTFTKAYGEVADKMLTLLSYGHKDNFGMGYNDGNTSFAKGESFMYIQGIWAINAVLQANPSMNIGAFAMPVNNDASKNYLVSGVDTVLSMPKDSKHPEEAMKFINFLMKKENSKKYIDEQKLFSTIQGVFQEDTILVGLKPFFESGKIAAFPDHSFPSGMQTAIIMQEFLIKKDKNAFLKIMDTEWDKVASR